MQTGSDGHRVTPLRLQDAEAAHEFPSHITYILNPGSVIPCTEILCRLMHVCLIEVGFIPIIEQESNIDVEALGDTTFAESVPKLVRSLRHIIDKVGNLHNVNYKAIVLEQPNSEEASSFNEDTGSSTESPSLLENLDEPGSKNDGAMENIPVTSKESGDESNGLPVNVELEREPDKETVDPVLLFSSSTDFDIKKTLSGTVSISIIHEGLSIYAVANGPGFHKNYQISLAQYIRPTNTDNFPMSARIEDYYRLMAFSVVRFVDDVKKGFCYSIMDEIDSLSFEIRSLSWLPAEIIVEVAKRCSPVMVFRLRAVCSQIRHALSSTNQQFWKMMLTRDFPLYNIKNLQSDMSLDKFYKKYVEMSNFSLRRPLRRALGQARMFPYYFLSNFRI